MSCEVFCFEIPEILHAFQSDSEGKLYGRLLSILQLPAPLDCYLAGYFEKTLAVLCRCLPAEMMMHLNASSGTISTMMDFLKHIDNYSIMQIVQRFLLPHIPFATAPPGEEEEENPPHCDWAFHEDTPRELCRLMLDTSGTDKQKEVSAHVSDLVVTVLQLSPADSPLLAHICQSGLVTALFAHAMDPNPELYYCCNAALSVLDSVCSRLCEAFLALATAIHEHDVPVDASSDAHQQNQQPHTAETLAELNAMEALIAQHISCVIACAAAHVTLFAENLAMLERDAVAANATMMMQTQRGDMTPRLGQRGIQLVKFLETLTCVAACTSDGDMGLCEALFEKGPMESAWHLCYLHPNNSIIHRAVHLMIVIVVESGAVHRYAQAYHRHDHQRHADVGLFVCVLLRLCQEYLFVKMGLLQRLMMSIEEAQHSMEGRRYGSLPIRGHLIAMAKVRTERNHSLNCAA